jgi:NifU-like protein involved in Fe-S cluster formation
MNAPRTRSIRTRRQQKSGRASALGAAVVAVILGFANLEPAHAAQCSTEEAAKIAVKRYGGKALSITPDGDVLVVRLQLADGRVIDVAVDRWGC